MVANSVDEADPAASDEERVWLVERTYPTTNRT